jgi:hypothetical protein
VQVSKGCVWLHGVTAVCIHNAYTMLSPCLSAPV